MPNGNPCPIYRERGLPYSWSRKSGTSPLLTWLFVNYTEFAKKLQSLARQENAQLLRVYEASFEGEATGKQEDFDLEFFLENARGIVEEGEEAAAAADK